MTDEVEEITGGLSRPAGTSETHEALRTMRNAQRLRVLLARMQYKRENRIPFTTAEETLLSELHRLYYLKPKKKLSVDSDGKVVIEKSVDASPIMEAVKDYSDLVGKKLGPIGARLHSVLDPVTTDRLMSETGLRLGTKEFARHVKKLTEGGELGKFRVRYGE